MRLNRFIMDVRLDDATAHCHCSVVNRIGNLDLAGRPCLVSESSGRARKTPFTVEAFSLDQPDAATKRWIGINQTASNRYVEHFLKQGAFRAMSGHVETISREVRLGGSRLDFLVNDDLYLEVKTPLVQIQTDVPDYVPRLPGKLFSSPIASSSSTASTTRTRDSATTTARPTTRSCAPSKHTVTLAPSSGKATSS